jgi:hypothetical protein
MSGLPVLTALLLATGSPLLAQATPAAGSDTYWLGGGLGAGTNDFAAQFNVSYQTGANLLSFRIATTAGIFSDSFGDVALLYGRGLKPPGNHASLAAGVALVHGCMGSGLGGCRDRPGVLGLPLEGQMFWRLSRAVGLDLYGFANLNHTRSFAGVTLSFQLGRLR